eukprot:TRINITY_DN29990_c0_g1_i1.p1 TRINITY_DN29990_c0_g1~~TRINITY_DN29990_c0_g1_i1.p1  ORF type:complete len:100 (+),score=4.13 TRINITY_DN29990_c0_g1_i1:34-300(+)
MEKKTYRSRPILYHLKELFLLYKLMTPMPPPLLFFYWKIYQAGLGRHQNALKRVTLLHGHLNGGVGIVLEIKIVSQIIQGVELNQIES